MQKHAMALGYFFLAVFCVYTGGQGTAQFYGLMILAAIAATLFGGVFFCSACSEQFHLSRVWFSQLMREARQPPVREPNVDE